MQVALVGTVGMRVTLRQRGRKDYALLNAEWVVYISFVINAFKKKFFVLLMFIKFFCVYILFYLLLSIFFGFCRLALFLRMWGVLVFRSAKW